jgi:hypothetical protein
MANGTRRTLISAVSVAALSLAAPAAANADWGAIAIDPKNGNAGIGFGEPTKTAAQNEAEKDCPGKCRQALFVLNKCGAIATNGKRFVGGFGNTKREAIKKARKKVGPDGRLIAFVCSG